MKKLFYFLPVILIIAACSSSRTAKKTDEQIPDIAGTWFQDGDTSVACYIVQNKESLVFLSGTQTSSGYFKNSYEVFAKDWSRNAILSDDHTTLTWKDRKWIKGSFRYPDISGEWYEGGEMNKRISITQNGTRLVMDNGIQKLNGYFYTTNAIYSLENNNYGTYSPKNNSITWGKKVWVRRGIR